MYSRVRSSSVVERIGVSIRPGRIALTRMPRLSSPAPSERASDRAAAFEAP